MKTPKIMTLLSDFGTTDPYVGVMKGAIARINPSVTVIDLTHDLPPQNLQAARFCLLSSYAYFPQGTVHVAVVDPGVGSSRRAIALQLPGAFLIGPDNGLFSGILAQEPILAAVELTNPRYWRTPDVSQTFHGRDIFAPAGAHLASGVPMAELGRAIAPETLVQLPLADYRQEPDRIQGTLQYIDRFGNLITNIPGDLVSGKSWFVKLADQKIQGDRTYASSPVGSAIALVGSHGYIEIAVNQGNAQQQLQLDWGATIQVMIAL
ncbi:MAG: SAM-dependent chlorinase/fluorinase [Desertifilum sp. SIO1I2]|nr:SAM-dependent chlorinase/fluorinase [Desertifilum sp. SIO1I2]